MMDNGWFLAARAAKYPTAREAAQACGVSLRLIELLEHGSTTAPELARRIGKALGLTPDEVKAITCQETVARREISRRWKQADKIVMARY